MSHFTVTVCLPADTDHAKVQGALEDILERWNENRQVEPYRDYEEGSPEDYWWVSSVRRGAEHLANGTGLGESERRSVFASQPARSVDEMRAEYAEDAEWAAKLGEHPTWETVAELYNAKYHPGTELAVPGQVDPDEIDTGRLHYDEETGRAYTWSRRNPESLWDWWEIGGRWRNSLLAKRGVQANALLISGRHWTEAYGNEAPTKWGQNGGLRCGGGPKALLDFEAMRDEAEAKAAARFDKWDAICARTPHADSWEHFVGLKNAGVITIEQARARYHAQPRIQEARKDDELSWDDPVEEFLPGREEYLAIARRGAIVGYALITLGREWTAAGRMGWFGMGTDEPGSRDAFKTAANAYLDSLADDVLIVKLDCHI